MTGEIINLNERRPKVVEPEISAEDSDRFADDMAADVMANELVHNLMIDFQSRGADLTTGDYHKYMEALAEVARMMAHRHFDVIDTYNLLLDESPDTELVIIVGDINKDELDG